jgi:biotin carboxyl carrier protein
MKMENAITADKDGTVKEIKVEAGQAVSAGDIVLVIE